MTTYLRKLGTFDATMVVVGGIIGAGIFLNPAIVAQRVTTPGPIMMAWILGGAVALLGALCFADLGVRRPEAGGGYVYLRDTFGRLPAFLYGWTQLVVIISGGIAAVAVTFASYAADLAGIAAAGVKPLAIGGILLLTVINIAGVRQGSLTQNLFTLLKLAALAVLIIAGIFLTPSAGGEPASDAPGTAAAQTAPVAATGLLLAMGAALIPVLFAFGGWQHVNNVAGEVKRPRRTLPLALLVGVAIVVSVYVLANMAYLRALGPTGLATSAAPAADSMRLALGKTGANLISAGIVLSTFGILNLFIMAAPRIYQAMAADGLFFKSAARLHPRFHTPSRALIFQAVWSAVLALSGTYGELLDWVVFGDWIFFGAVVATLFVYHRRETQTAKPSQQFRVPLYPWTPALFVLVAGLVVAASIYSNPANALLGSGLIAAGIPVFLLWQRRVS